MDHQDLYNYLLSVKFIDKNLPYDKFESAFKDPNKLRGIYDGLKTFNVGGVPSDYAKMSFDDFSKKYSNPTVKKKDGGVASPDGQSEQPSTASAPNVGIDFIEQAKQDAKQLIFTGLEDPELAGDQIRQARLGADYESKKRYETGTTMRAGKWRTDNVLLYGQEARRQANEAETSLASLFGADWKEKTTQYSQMLQNVGDNPDPATKDAAQQAGMYLQNLQNNPNYTAWRQANNAMDVAQGRFNEIVTKGGYAEAIKWNKEAQADIDKDAETNPVSSFFAPWMLQKVASLGGGILALPRTLQEAAFPSDMVLPMPKAYTETKSAIADHFGNWGDQLTEWGQTYFPTPTKYSRPLIEDAADFEGLKVIVKNGKAEKVMMPNGELTDPSDDFRARFDQSGAGKNTSWTIPTGGNLLGKVLNGTADIFIMRFGGGGTKGGTAGVSFLMNHQNAYKDAMEGGMNPQEAAEYASVSSLILGAMEAYIGDIETNIFKKPALNAASRLGSQEMASVIGRGTPAQAAWARIKPVIMELASENKEELLSALAGDGLKMAFNYGTGSKMDLEVSKKSILETIAVTTATTLPAAVFGMGGHVNEVYRNNVMVASENLDNARETLNNMVQAGTITQAQMDASMDRFTRINAAVVSLPEGTSIDTRSRIAGATDYILRQEADLATGAASPGDARTMRAKENIKRANQYISDLLAASDAENAGLQVNHDQIDGRSDVGVAQNANDAADSALNPPEETATTAPAEGATPPPISVTQATDSTTPTQQSPEFQENYGGYDGPAYTSATDEDIAVMRDAETVPDITMQLSDVNRLGDEFLGVEDGEDKKNSLQKVAMDSFVDDAAKMLRQKGITLSEKELPSFVNAIHDATFGAGSMENPDMTVEEAIDRATDKWAMDRHGEAIDASLSDFGDAQAEFARQLLDGARIIPDHDFMLPTASRRYFSALNGISVAEMAQRIADNTGVTIDQAFQGMKDFMKKHPQKDIGRFIQNKSGATPEFTGKVSEALMAAKESIGAEQYDALSNFLRSYPDDELPDIISGDITNPEVDNFKKENPDAWATLQQTYDQLGSQSDEGRQAEGQGGQSDIQTEENQTEGGGSVSQAIGEPVESSTEIPLTPPQVEAATGLPGIDPIAAALGVEQVVDPAIVDDVTTDAQIEQAAEATQRAKADPNARMDVAHIGVVETPTEFIVTNSNGIRDIMRSLGGKWIAGRGWVFPIGAKEKVLAGLGFSQAGNTPLPKTIPVTTGHLRDQHAMLNRAIYLQRKKLEARLKKALSLEEKLRIAEQMLTLADTSRKDFVKKVADRLSKSFPGVTLITDQDQVNEAAKQFGDNAPAGWVQDGKVYINLERANPDTPIHEFGHIWAQLTRITNPDLHKAGMDLMRGSEYEAAVREDSRYAHLDEDGILDEAMSIAIGESGARIMNRTTWQAFQDFLSSMWMNAKRAVGLHPKGLSAREFSEQVAARMLKGDEVHPDLAESIEAAKKKVDTDKKKEKATAMLGVARVMEYYGHGIDEILAMTGFSRDEHGRWDYRPERSQYSIKQTAALVEDGKTTVGEMIDILGLSQNISDMEISVTDEKSKAVYSDGKVSIILNRNDTGADIAKIVQQLNALEKTGLHTPDHNWTDISGKVDSISNMDPYYQFPDGNMSAGFERAMAGDGPVEPHSTTGYADSAMSPDAQMQWGDNALRYTAAQSAVNTIIQSEIDNGARTKDEVINALDGRFPFDRPTLESMWDTEVIRRQNAETVTGPGGLVSRTVEKMTERSVKIAKKWFSYKGMLPFDIWVEEANRRHRIAAMMYDVDQTNKRLEAALKEVYGKKGATEDQRKAVYNALSGNGDISLLPGPISTVAMEMRNMIDKTTEEALRMGAIPPGTVLTVLENMGVEVSTLPGGDRAIIAKVLSTPPHERTDAENQMVDDFLLQHKNDFGTYLNRSYRIHDYPDWKDIVPPHLISAAKANMLSAFRQEEADIVQGMEEFLQHVQDQRDAAEKTVQNALAAAQIAVDDANKALVKSQDRLNQLIANSADPAAIQKQMNTILKREGDVTSKEAILDEAIALAGLTPADANFISDAVMGIGASNARVIRQLIAARKNVYDLEQKADRLGQDMQPRLDRVRESITNVDNYINSILDTDKNDKSFIRSPKLGSANMGVLKHRQEIDEAIRMLMGEYQDPVINFAKTMWKTGHIVESKRMLNDLASRYNGIYFFDHKGAAAGAYRQIAASGNQAMAPMDGMYTTPDIAEAMESFYATDVMADWQKFFLIHIATNVKLGKTILSPVTQVRNVVGNLAFCVQHGWGPMDMARNWEAYKNALLNKGESTRELYEMGILGESVTAGDMKDMISAIDHNYIPILTADQRGVTSAIGNGIHKTYEKAKSAYEAGDNLYRVLGYFAERDRYAKALFKGKFDTLTADQQQEVKQRAAKVILNQLPTYSYIPKVARLIRAIPFVGTFVAFPSEMIRVSYNTFVQINDDFKDPRTRGIGIRRSIGTIAVAGATWAIAETLKAAFGYTDDEWKEINEFVPDYQKYGDLVPYGPRDKHGNISYVNMSYSDPYSFIKKAFNATLADDNKTLASKATAFIGQVVEPFIQPELTFNTLGHLAYNIDDKPNPDKIRLDVLKDPVFGTSLLHPENIQRQFEYTRKKLQPGIVKSIWDIYDLYTVPADNSGKIKTAQNIALSHTLGLQVEKFDPKVSFGFQMRAATELRNQCREIFSDEQSSMNRTYNALKDSGRTAAELDEHHKLAQERLDAKYAVTQDAYVKLLQDCGKKVQSIRKLHASDSDIIGILKDARFNEDEIRSIITQNYDGVHLVFKKRGQY